jgi:hypothetical protein
VNPICWYHRASGRIRFDGTNLSSSWIPLYAKQEWSGLTDEEVHEAFCHVEYETPNDWNTDPDDWCQQFARYLEAKLREKNAK